jgi:hypothetical protein
LFKPIVKKINLGAISKELLAVAASKGINVDTLDFEILKVNTYYKIVQKTSWKPVAKEQLAKLLEEKNLINPSLLITQDYHVKIFHKESAEPTTFKPIISFGANPNKTFVKAVIKSESKFGRIDNKFQINIYNEINKRKLKNGIMIGVLDKELIKGIKELLRTIIEDRGLKNDVDLIAAKGINQVNGTPDSVEYLYLQKEQEGERNYVDPVEKDEMILTYTKATPSMCGRGCDGSVLYPKKVEVAFPNGISHDATIYKNIDKDMECFFAAKGGYVAKNQDGFSIQNSVSLKEASFKGSGSIYGKDEKSISVNISESDSALDAISSGVKLDVQSVDVAGSVGGNAKINAEAVKIGSQTHRNSVIEADMAEVHLHRGNLKTKEADINILETGKIEAQIARIKKALGGEIIAKEVTIDELVSNVKITASQSVTIKTISGEGNKIRISAEAGQDDNKIAQIKESIKIKHEEIEALKVNQKEISQKLIEEEPRRKKFQQKLIAAKKAGQKPPVAVMAKVREYLRYEEELKNFDANLASIQNDIKAYEDEMHAISKMAFDAVINCDGHWDGHTEIVFVHPESGVEYRLVPTAHETNIKLQDLGDGNAQITFD